MRGIAAAFEEAAAFPSQEGTAAVASPAKPAHGKGKSAPQEDCSEPYIKQACLQVFESCKAARAAEIAAEIAQDAADSVGELLAIVGAPRSERPAVPPPVPSGFDRDADSKIVLAIAQRPTSLAEVKTSPQQFVPDSNFQADEFEIRALGPVPSKRLAVQFLGLAAPAARRAAKLLGCLKKRDGTWHEFSVSCGTNSQCRLRLCPGESPSRFLWGSPRVVSAKRWRPLALAPGSSWTRGAAPPSVERPRVARVSVSPGSEAPQIHLGPSNLAKTGWDKQRCLDVRVSELSSLASGCGGEGRLEEAELVPGRGLRVSVLRGDASLAAYNVRNRGLTCEEVRSVASEIFTLLSYAAEGPNARFVLVNGDFNSDADSLPLSAPVAALEPSGCQRHARAPLGRAALARVLELEGQGPTRYVRGQDSEAIVDREFVPTPSWQACQHFILSSVRAAADVADREISDRAAAFPSLNQDSLLCLLGSLGLSLPCLDFVRFLYAPIEGIAQVTGLFQRMYWLLSCIMQGRGLSGALFALGSLVFLEDLQASIEGPQLGLARACADGVGGPWLSSRGQWRPLALRLRRLPLIALAPNALLTVRCRNLLYATHLWSGFSLLGWASFLASDALPPPPSTGPRACPRSATRSPRLAPLVSESAPSTPSTLIAAPPLPPASVLAVCRALLSGVRSVGVLVVRIRTQEGWRCGGVDAQPALRSNYHMNGHKVFFIGTRAFTLPRLDSVIMEELAPPELAAALAAERARRAAPGQSAAPAREARCASGGPGRGRALPDGRGGGRATGGPGRLCGEVRILRRGEAIDAPREVARPIGAAAEGCGDGTARATVLEASCVDSQDEFPSVEVGAAAPKRARSLPPPGRIPQRQRRARSAAVAPPQGAAGHSAPDEAAPAEVAAGGPGAREEGGSDAAADGGADRAERAGGEAPAEGGRSSDECKLDGAGAAAGDGADGAAPGDREVPVGGEHNSDESELDGYDALLVGLRRQLRATLGEQLEGRLSDSQVLSRASTVDACGAAGAGGVSREDRERALELLEAGGGKRRSSRRAAKSRQKSDRKLEREYIRTEMKNAYSATVDQGVRYYNSVAIPVAKGEKCVDPQVIESLAKLQERRERGLEPPEPLRPTKAERHMARRVA
ncbi:unnamed protein product [Prorocentrum cordatum]|uniref:Uncharacterized protein n=1 Tax=Prorocentrum cordatum TaxID=2364126 RepID=A0ABN9YG06_9DINO|nr:unnamed protein product [Polarella glacialis]